MNLVAYYRVSTVRQGQSGLGLEAQRISVEHFASSNNGSVIQSFTEIESGKRNTRPEIAKAIALCKQTGATLVVAKLDRLARNVAFTATLMDSGCEFVCCDNPNASKLTIHILAAVSQEEGERISKRVKESLAVAKAKGVRLGAPTTHLLAASGREANSTAAAAHAETIRPVASRKRASGKSYQEVADYLNRKGLRTRRGGLWSPTAVLRLLAA